MNLTRHMKTTAYVFAPIAVADDGVMGLDDEYESRTIQIGNLHKKKRAEGSANEFQLKKDEKFLTHDAVEVGEFLSLEADIATARRIIDVQISAGVVGGQDLYLAKIA